MEYVQLTVLNPRRARKGGGVGWRRMKDREERRKRMVINTSFKSKHFDIVPGSAHCPGSVKFQYVPPVKAPNKDPVRRDIENHLKQIKLCSKYLSKVMGGTLVG